MFNCIVEDDKMKHFGVNLIQKKYAFNLNREQFALINKKPSLPKFESLVAENAYVDETATEYSLAWCEKYRELCLKNYDLQMKYFSTLDSQNFNDAIICFLKKYKKFCEIDSLLDYEDVEGYYMMVLAEYKQVYIGKSCNIKKRIQQHWTKTKEFDRTLFPMYAVNTSCFSIDFFRALDTTKIFVWKRKLIDGVEQELIKNFPQEFSCNRVGGDITEAIEALATIKKRNLP